MTARQSFAPMLAALLIAIGAGSFSSAHAQHSAAEPLTKLAKSQAGFYRLKIGDIAVTALSDGTIPLETKILTNTKGHHVARLLKDGFAGTTIDASINAFLIETAGKLILVDAGTGELYGPTLNKLPASLRAIGVEPAQITDILLTHVHTDHSGGLMDGTTRVFPNAVIHVERKEVDYWLDPQALARAPESQKQYFQQAKAKIGPYADSGQIEPFDGAVELFPGIRSVPAPGHTPGHTFYSLESRGEKLMFWGDVLHVAEVQLAAPGVTIQYDVDPKEAAAARRRAFADAAAKGYLVAPAHYSFPGVGHLRKVADGYRFVPLTYVNDALPVKR
ncbi:glyoxylase-like metal-dependent hydrolase (beta-lactamase superfamily II) [Variovorax sp. W1I1]|uniref:MBL fold metallo-hydrolase n=1 Tax=Variovorax sp. W1I1 TaxID=3042309 RepID=UPI00278971B6|nr:MBL fold metallo-hydrolase [Variovorax sp. W1I1]MDQ0610905.1 glyoxylase-like metal-dependent hydrolase (beta-lactamase superfamily II) [Variovorax sp. W1I1]